MPTSRHQPSPLAAHIATALRRHDNDYPLWKGPCDLGPLGGITQSMLVRFLSCRERFRLRYILGLEPPDKWNHRIGYGNMWHVCEEALSAGGSEQIWRGKLADHVIPLYQLYPMQREELDKWWNVCGIQFSEYVRYWLDHPDVKERTPLMQEKPFDVSYILPSGRTVRLRGKWDSVDVIDGGIYLQENKTKGNIDRQQIERQLKFDLQTMMYLVALDRAMSSNVVLTYIPYLAQPIRGVRYNVVRRPFSGGVGNIRPHSAKSGKTTFTPAETDEQFYERLRRDYIAADPAYWFFRVRTEVSPRDIQVFRETCLDPILEQLCDWYNQTSMVVPFLQPRGRYQTPMNYRTPFGVWSALEEGGATEYDSYLETGSEAGLPRTETLFVELQ